MKDVINYSKEYTLAVVPVDIVYDADLRGVFSVLREAGERLRAENPDVLAQTEIDGITAFGATAMTVARRRASSPVVTRPRPPRFDSGSRRRSIVAPAAPRGAGSYQPTLSRRVPRILGTAARPLSMTPGRSRFGNVTLNHKVEGSGQSLLARPRLS